MGLLDTNVRVNIETNARDFLKKYTEFIVSFNVKEKGQFISKKRDEFLRNYTRDKVQQQIDADMSMLNAEDSANEAVAYEYLVNP